MSWEGYTFACVRAHVQMCLTFRISKTAGRIALKFGEWLSHNLLVARGYALYLRYEWITLHVRATFHILVTTGCVVMILCVLFDTH